MIGCSPKAVRGGKTVASRPGTVVEVYHAITETAFIQPFEIQVNVVGEGQFAASHHNGREDQMIFVDQPSQDRLSGEIGTAHRYVTSHLCLHQPDRFRVEVALNARSRTGYRLQ